MLSRARTAGSRRTCRRPTAAGGDDPIPIVREFGGDGGVRRRSSRRERTHDRGNDLSATDPVLRTPACAWWSRLVLADPVRAGGSVCSLVAGRANQNERKIMKVLKRTPAIAAALAAVALAAAGCSSSGSSSSAGGGSSSGSSGGTVDFYSSLPLQGASTAQTTPMVNGMKLALAQANNKAGQWTVNYQSLDDSTAAAGKWDPGQTAANARKVATDPEGRLLHGRVQLGRQRGVGPDPQPGGNPPGQPGEHVRRPDDEPSRQRPWRAAEVLPERDPYLPADRADRLDPGRLRPDRDEAGRLHEGRRRQRQGGVRRRPGDAARAGEGRLTASRSRATPGSTRPRPTSVPTRRRSRAREPTASSSPASSPTAPSSSPRTSTRRCPTPRSSAATASARTPTRTRPRAASRPRSTR